MKNTMDGTLKKNQPPAERTAHAAPALPKQLPVEPNQDGQPDSIKGSGQAGRKAQAVNQNLPQAQGARQPDRGGKKP
jgi:hypothetical protein